MFIMKLALPRRTFLRGLGVTIGLPFLDAMAPARKLRRVKRCLEEIIGGSPALFSRDA